MSNRPFGNVIEVTVVYWPFNPTRGVYPHTSMAQMCHLENRGAILTLEEPHIFVYLEGPSGLLVMYISLAGLHHLTSVNACVDAFDGATVYTALATYRPLTFEAYVSNLVPFTNPFQLALSTLFSIRQSEINNQQISIHK